MRLRYYAEFYDTLRLDHAKGFFNYGAVNLSDPSRDKVEVGPGEPVLNEIVATARKAGLKVFAEDSGDRLIELRRTLRKLKVPGVRILRFAYNEKKKKFETDYSDVANYPTNTYACTSTHDTIPLISYLKVLNKGEKRHLCLHVGVGFSSDNRILARRLRQAVIDSPASHVILPLRDWLLLPDRINVPGTERPVADPNWRWRMPLPVERLPLSIPKPRRRPPSLLTAKGERRPG
jgi:4-alpha-glucanotransferase